MNATEPHNVFSLSRSIFSAPLNMRRLSRLNLSNNKLECIRKNWLRGLFNLEILDLSNNLISEIEPLSLLDINLKQLNLVNNKIDKHDKFSFDGLSSGIFIDLTGNNLSNSSRSVLRQKAMKFKINIVFNNNSDMDAKSDNRQLVVVKR